MKKNTAEEIAAFETRVSGKGTPREKVWLWRWAGERDSYWMVSKVPIAPGNDVEIMGEYERCNPN